MTSVTFVKRQNFLRYSWKRYEKNTHLLFLERHKLNAEVSQWEKAQLSSSYHICHIQFPRDLTFKIVLHGFTKEWKPESKQLNSRTSGVKKCKKILICKQWFKYSRFMLMNSITVWDCHWWGGLWAYQIITQIIAFWDFGYFYSLICKQNSYNKLFLTKSYLENCLYRKPREKVNCSLWKALNYIITVENTGGRR